MGKSRLEKVIRKIIKTHYPKLMIKSMNSVQTNSFSDGKWTPDGYCFFIDVENETEYIVSEIEYFVGTVSGQEIIIHVV